jgi:hypothetical protein
LAAPLFTGNGGDSLGSSPFTRLDVLHRESLEAVLPEFGIGPSAVPPSELDALNLRLAQA